MTRSPAPTISGVAILGIAVALIAGCAGPIREAPGEPIRIGAVFPIEGNAAVLAIPELAGVRIAAQLVNADGGIGGRPIVLEVRPLEARADAPGVMADLRRSGVEVVIGAYSSDLSIAASAAAHDAGLVYWEAGAVADRLTGRGLDSVFRVGATGANLGANAAAFAASQLAPRLGKTAADLRIALAVADDEYANGVADAAESTATAAAMPVVIRRSYNLLVPDWPAVMADLAAARPDAIILASHIPDGIAFRQAMLAAGLRVDALIGATMAECDPDFAGELGPDAVGIFASDRPTSGFRPEALLPAARASYDRFAAAWAADPTSRGAGRYGSQDDDGDGGNGAASEHGEYGGSDSSYTITGPDNPTAEADEEALAGFTAGWALFHHVLPAAAGLDGASIAAAARALDLPAGSLPNGAGLRFSADPATLGQNERAAAVIWQWQAVRAYEFVWPASYATGEIAFVPLPR